MSRNEKSMDCFFADIARVRWVAIGTDTKQGRTWRTHLWFECKKSRKAQSCCRHSFVVPVAQQVGAISIDQ